MTSVAATSTLKSESDSPQSLPQPNLRGSDYSAPQVASPNRLKPNASPIWSRIVARLARVSTDRRRRRIYRAMTPLRVAWAYLCDARRFTRAAHLRDPFKNRLAASAHLLRAAHSLEKGQCLPDPRPGFGVEKIRELLRDTARYQQRFGCDEVSSVIIALLRGTQRFHARTGHARDEWESALQVLEETQRKAGRGPTKPIDSVTITRSEILAGAPIDPEAFFLRRFSIRQFEPGPIERAVIERAIVLAQKTPSVCNRQSARVHVFTDATDMLQVLKHQDGNAGFGHQAGAVMVITSDLSCFYKEGERNQGFVDGGMFAVSLVYALHSLGLGSCLLNWSRGPYDDAQLRREIGLPENEVIITLLAVGRLRERFTVAASPRRPLSQVVTWATLSC